ncbi:hypothetical protein VC279_22560 [Xanthomonas sp. WHRI 10064A]|uniref:hypothetical protein n=1 Tax=unclassified Xanthomonas TaxID=2643310 RepID=UPI002B22D22B|nr:MULTISPECIES: hypothetical protein [unclassified Xanthomonas]MEA9589738.1 hypothetical protein [Xanthomonas sp. WHRI 10064B]MEA9617376.1 hypothetical protein [Xanthomonas sp. WHRI 10064A]
MLAASKGIKLLVTQEQHDAVVDKETRKKSTFSNEKTTTHDAWHDSLAVGSPLSGKSVNMVAGNDLAVLLRYRMVGASERVLDMDINALSKLQ